jgi:DNA-binding winged helix-turn-helix (wHTH) protein
MMLEFPPFRLGTVNQCVWRQDAADVERIPLTPKEFAVLNHLVGHADRLVTHRELLDAVWPNTAIEPLAVKNNILNLRRALGDASKRAPFIETIPRRGYRFIATIENGDTANVPGAPQ